MKSDLRFKTSRITLELNHIDLSLLSPLSSLLSPSSVPMNTHLSLGNSPSNSCYFKTNRPRTVRNPGRKSGSQIRFANPGRKSRSQIQVANPGRNPGRTSTNVRIRILDKYSPCIFIHAFRAANVRISINPPFQFWKNLIFYVPRISLGFTCNFKYKNDSRSLWQGSPLSVFENLIFHLPQISLGFTCNFNYKNDSKSLWQGPPPFQSWKSHFRPASNFIGFYI